MSPKNARLKSNGDQSSSATIWTDAVIGAEVSTDKTESIPKPLLAGKVAGVPARGFKFLNVLIETPMIVGLLQPRRERRARGTFIVLFFEFIFIN